VRISGQGIELCASDRKGSEGQTLLVVPRGTFRAAVHRNIGWFQLLLFVPDKPPIELRGKWSPSTGEPMRVARLVASLAKKT